MVKCGQDAFKLLRFQDRVTLDLKFKFAGKLLREFLESVLGFQGEIGMNKTMRRSVSAKEPECMPVNARSGVKNGPGF